MSKLVPLVEWESHCQSSDHLPCLLPQGNEKMLKFLRSCYLISFLSGGVWSICPPIRLSLLPMAISQVSFLIPLLVMVLLLMQCGFPTTSLFLPTKFWMLQTSSTHELVRWRPRKQRAMTLKLPSIVPPFPTYLLVLILPQRKNLLGITTR